MTHMGHFSSFLLPPMVCTSCQKMGIRSVLCLHLHFFSEHAYQGSNYSQLKRMSAVFAGNIFTVGNCRADVESR